ncbi:hypothetical protein [Actinomadura yumaensis]|uniref:DUF2510 domain-containing protein n=1 Tax=Actinomadura yumaensis TaxID=111807 RepID=A0ABW2CVD7_9ACTN
MNRQETHGRPRVTGAAMVLRGGPWQVVAPTAVEIPHLLTGVAAASPTQVWAVGNASQQPLAAYWDGTAWTVPPGPAPDAAFLGAALQGVACTWTPVPGSGPGSGPQAQAGGSDVPGQRPGALGGTGAAAAGLEASSSLGGTGASGAPYGPPGPTGGTDASPGEGLASAGRSGRSDGPPQAGNGPYAIAVGGAYDRLAGTEVPLVRHWDGESWRSWDAWSAPELARGYVLTDVAMLPDGTAWAVGHGFPRTPAENPAGPSGTRVGGRADAGPGGSGPVALRWTGRDWAPAAMPNVPKGKLLAVSAAAPGDVWAVGAADRAGLITHYDGRAWRWVAAPSTRFPLTDVTAVSPEDVWAVGRDRVLRWNGRKWRRVKSPVTAANTVTAVGPDDVWVAGGRGELAHFDGHRWTLEASPQPLGEGAVWLASTSTRQDGVWLVGTRQQARTGPLDGTPTITARSTDT